MPSLGLDLDRKPTHTHTHMLYTHTETHRDTQRHSKTLEGTKKLRAKVFCGPLLIGSQAKLSAWNRDVTNDTASDHKSLLGKLHQVDQVKTRQKEGKHGEKRCCLVVATSFLDMCVCVCVEVQFMRNWSVWLVGFLVKIVVCAFVCVCVCV